MYNWQLAHVNSSLNMWGIALWQHTTFTVVTDRILWSIKCGRSAIFLEIHLFENKRKRSLVRIPPIFSNVFVWATRRRAMERNWHIHSIYAILAARRYLPQSWHLSKLKMLIRKKFSRHVWLRTYLRWSHKLPNAKLIFKNRRIKAYFDA